MVVLIKRVRAGTECAVVEEQYGFRQGIKCLLYERCVKNIQGMGKMHFGR